MCQKAQRSTCRNQNNKNEDDGIIPNVNLLSSSPLLSFIKYQKLKIVRIRVCWTGTINAEHQVNWEINCFGASVINVDSENTPTNHWLLPLANWTYRRPQPSRYNPNVFSRPWTLFSLLFLFQSCLYGHSSTVHNARRLIAKNGRLGTVRRNFNNRRRLAWYIAEKVTNSQDQEQQRAWLEI